MLSNNPIERPDCAQILAENYSWSITERDVSYYGLDDLELMKEIPDQFIFFKYFLQQKLLSFNRLDRRFKVIENIWNGTGSVLKVQNESDKNIFTIKKVPNGIYYISLLKFTNSMHF